jgi:hypothetical protein
MAENKKQHFVPRFYLGNFSFDGGARTNLIRIAELKAISGIGVADQCQDAYFYGKDLTLEKALATIEASAAKVIRGILGGGTIAPHGTPEDAVLKTHICLQWTRTRSFSEGLDSSLSQMLKLAHRGTFRRAGFSESDLQDVEFGREEGPRDAVANGADYIPFFADLEPKLVHANDLGEFVTSDDPVVLTNPFYLGRFPGGIAGPALEGTVVLYPVSPQFLVILYDRKCYRVGAPGKRIVPLSSVSDLIALNNHHFLNASENLYHRDAAHAPKHLAEFSNVKNLRNESRQIVREVPMEPGKSLLHTFTEPINYKPPTSFMKVLRSRRGETEPVPRIPDRDPALSQHFKAYSEALQAGKIPKGFVAYVARIAELILSETEKAAWSTGPL